MVFTNLCTLLTVSYVFANWSTVWCFNNENALKVWQPNIHIKTAQVIDSKLRIETEGSDPYLLCEGLELVATPYQYVTIKIRSNRSGKGQLFWSGTNEGQFGGFSQRKSIMFDIKETSDWQDIIVFPAWHVEGKIIKLRLDLFDGMICELEKIQIGELTSATTPLVDTYGWNFNESDYSPWQLMGGNDNFIYSPALDLPLKNKKYVCIDYSCSSNEQGILQLLWITSFSIGTRVANIPLIADSKRHTIVKELNEYDDWRGNLYVIGFRVFPNKQVSIYSLSIIEQPLCKPDLCVLYAGFEEGVNRVNNPCTLLIRLANCGGAKLKVNKITIESDILFKYDKKHDPELPAEIDFDDYKDFRQVVIPTTVGATKLKTTIQCEGIEDVNYETDLYVLPAISNPIRAEYVPEPRPVKTKFDICAFYFPGWDKPEKWDCIRTLAPNRKPILGYYDEGNPECVDWSIKWAVENGITCFLVDWYWISGKQLLTHWFQAYKKARYKDYLKVAIMWANHNPPKTHSVEDWEAVNKEWIEYYFSLPSYYKINNKPLVCIWSPRDNLRADMGGPEKVKELIERSQQLAKSAGYDGVEFMAINHNHTKKDLEILKFEGYSCFTNYHEFEKTVYRSEIQNFAEYKNIVEDLPYVWEEKDSMSSEVVYYPVIETGWDSRPWHGSNALVIQGRSAELFKQLLRSAKEFAEKKNKKMIILGPLNEWGEGSYIEPNTEFGFSMYESIREVFAEPPYPENLSPQDVSLGPYDFDFYSNKEKWEFQNDTEGWKIYQGITELKVVDGTMQGTTDKSVPTIYYYFFDGKGLRADLFSSVKIKMKLQHPSTIDHKLTFGWSNSGVKSGEVKFLKSQCISIPIIVHPDYQTYVIDLSQTEEWTGWIKTIMISPTSESGGSFHIDSIELVRK